ncbi:PQQ-like domain-containing protein [Amycolatopsis marina]|uniref:PQQ-like domain-containing protein n=2 Tax=Amycolatopsis marina TaxID=490629 RepID=A0A1I0W6U4_9PSEU|nr:PQQ-like domain-containing protein [Amycolatopsis marina]
MLIAATLLIVAAFQPTTVKNGYIPPPADWFIVVVVVASVLAAISAWVVFRGRPAGWRGGAVLLGLAVAGGVRTFQELPIPSPSGGIGSAGAWALLGCGWLAIAGVLLVLAHPSPSVTPTATGWRAPTASAAATLVVAGLLTVTTPHVVVAANTDATTTAREAPPAEEPVLNGGQAWDTDQGSEPSTAGPGRDAIATAGGLLVASSAGVRMLDGSTGEEHWHHYRYDWRYFHYENTYFRGPDVGQSWDDTNLIVAGNGRVAAVNMTRVADGEDTEADTRTWVFDTISGQVLSETDGDRAVAIAGDLVLSTNEVLHGGSGRVNARAWSGEQRWEHPLPEGCELGGAHAVPGDRIVLSVRCDVWTTDTSPHVLALDAGTGELAWRWQPPEAGRMTIRPGEAEHEDTVLVQVRLGDNRNPEQSVYALDTASGEARWQRERLRLQHDSADEPNGDDWYWSTITWAGPTPVLAESELTEGRFVLVGLDASDGSTTWTRKQPDRWRIPYGMQENPRMTGPVLGLDDGRLLAAAVLETNALKPRESLALTTIDAANGEELNDIVVRGRDFDIGFRLHRAPATVVATGERTTMIALS